MGIRRAGRCWDVCAGGVRLSWDTRRLTWAVERNGAVWRSAQSGPDALGVRDRAFTTFFPLALSSARRVKTTPLVNGAQEGLVCEVGEFAGLPKGGRLSLHLSLMIEHATGDLVVTIDARTENLVFRHLLWPGAIEFQSPAGGQETVMPLMQGAVIPGDWPTALPLRGFCTQSRGLYMPWWGQRRGQAGYMAIIETDADAGCRFEHPAGGPTRVQPRWDNSLGLFAYPRVIRYSFFDRCDYVSMCKHYRRHVISRGRFVSLREKIIASPKVGRLIGSPVIHTGVAHTMHPRSHHYSKEHPERNVFRRPFRDVAKDLKSLYRRGVDRAYLHLDGWGVEGYDSHHPDYLPPCPDIGGWAGMRHLADTCARLGYLFALHDQYRDYYHNATSYDPEQAIRELDGTIPYGTQWCGGPQSVLCARFAPAYVRRNHQTLRDRGIRVDGTYLDVFAVVEPDQCVHPAHRMTRRECQELRARCFAIIRELEGIVSSEEPVDFAVPHMHLAHHGPFLESEWVFGAKDIAVPVAPLWSLVYHDALLLPWAEPIHAALYGGMPYLDLKASAAEIAAVRRVGRAHARLALQEMVGHEFLSEDRTRERTTFADGTTVTADLKARTWTIESTAAKTKTRKNRA